MRGSAVTLLASFTEGKFDARTEPGDAKMKEAMTGRADDVRLLGKLTRAVIKQGRPATPDARRQASVAA